MKTSLKKCLLLLVISIFAYACKESSPIKIDETFSIESSNKQLIEVFNWAKEKAYFYVQTGKTGPVEVWENGAATDTVSYIPSYWAGYPGRSAYYSRDFCHQIEGAHLLGLREENFNMLQTFAASANEEQKWFPVWALNFDGSIYKLDYKNSSNFVREVPAAFELVEKGYQLFLWTRDQRYINDPTLWNFYTKVVSDFIDLHDTQLPNGVAEGTGKGIFQGAASYNEQRDLPLIESGDGIASQYQAYLAYAEMAKLRNEITVYDEFKEKAAKLKNYYNNDWGIKDTDLFNRGYLQDGTPVVGWGKENSWFMPMKNITDSNSERARNYLTYINTKLENKDDIPANIEAISYIPELYFKHHQNELGFKWMQHIMNNLKQEHTYEKATGRNGDYPEVSYVLLRNMVVDLMGVQPIAKENTFSTLSHLPKDVKHMGLSNISMGTSHISVSHYENSKTEITYNSGLEPLTCLVQFYGNHKNLIINNVSKPAQQTNDNGATLSFIELTLNPLETIQVYTSK